MDQLNDANPLEKRLVNKANEARIPITANFELTPTCNLHCDMCFIRMEHSAVQAMGGVRTLEYLRYKKGKDFKAYAQGMAQNFQQGVYATTDLGLDCRASKSSCWFDWRGRLTPCCVMEEPAVILKGTTVAEAWKQIVTTSESLPKHTECNGCSLRMICDVCYAAAYHEKKACGNLNYLCEMSRTKKKAFIHETN